jgi:hypothetical protein
VAEAVVDDPCGSGLARPTRLGAKQLQLRSRRDAEYLFSRRLPHCYRPPHRMPNPAGVDSSGFFCSLGKRNLLAAFKEEPHERQEQQKF